METANEILVRLRTNDGAEGFGLATSYASAEPTVQAFRAGVDEQILGMDPLAPERLHEKLVALTSGRLAHEKGWGREALIRIAAAVDIACDGAISWRWRARQRLGRLRHVRRTIPGDQ